MMTKVLTARIYAEYAWIPKLIVFSSIAVTFVVAFHAVKFFKNAPFAGNYFEKKMLLTFLNL